MNGRPWTREEDNAVREAFAKSGRHALEDVASALCRSVATVRFRAYNKLGLRRAKAEAAGIADAQQAAIAQAYLAWKAPRGAA